MANQELERRVEERTKALQESESKLRAVFDHTPVCLNLKDTEGRYLLVNKPYEEWLGHPKEKIIGKKSSEFLQDATRVEAMSADERTVMESGEVNSQEMHIKGHDGKFYDRLVIKFPVKSDEGAISGVGTATLDITKRKQAEEALTESEMRFRSVIDNSPIFITLKDTDGRFKLVNQTHTDLFGFEPQDIIGKRITEVLHKKVAEDSAAQERKAIDTKSVVTEERPIITEKGTFDFLITKFPVVDKSGDVMEIGTIGTDITERKQAEDAILETQARLSGILRIAPEAIIAIDEDMNIRLFNEGAERIFGYSADEVIRQSIDMLMPERYHSGHANHVKAFDRSKDASRRMEQRQEVLGLRKDGTEFPAAASVSKLESGGEKIYTVMLHDITEQKRVNEALLASEERFKNFAESASDWFWEMDQNLRFTGATQRREELTGLPIDEFIGKTRWEVVGADPEKDERWRDHNATLESHQPFRDFEIEQPDANGRAMTLSVSGRPIFDQAGNFKGYRGSATDITLRVQAEKLLRQSQKIEAISQLTGGIAHDFNNLLTVISSNLDLLDEDLKENIEALSLVHAAKTASFRGSELTRQLLSFSHEQVLHPESVNANDLLRNVIVFLKRSLGENIMFKTRFARDLRAIHVDQGMLGDAFLNLALNARDAMPEGGVLRVNTRNVKPNDKTSIADGVSSSDPQVLITVSDTGSGMDEETLKQVFEPFFTTKGVGKGSGLGLSMVYGFVTQSNGFVSVKSKPGKGTTVKFYFPAVKDQNEKRMPPSEKLSSMIHGSETILVVEDDAAVRRIAVKTLGRLGYEILEAEDGPSALEIMSANGGAVDLVFSDIIMPNGMSGFDLVNELNRHYQGIKILMTSGYSEDIIGEDKIADQGITLLKKPYKKTELAGAVRATLDQ